MSKQLAKEIRQYAKAQKIPVKDVLKMTKVNSSQLYNWENGGNSASKDTENRVRAIIGVMSAMIEPTFITRTLTVEDVPLSSTEGKKEELLYDSILTIMHDESNEVPYKLELIRFLLSK